MPSSLRSSADSPLTFPSPRSAPAASGAHRPARVCHLAYSFYENDNRVTRYAETLAARGDRVDVITLRRPGQPSRATAGGVEIFRLQRRSRGEKAAWVYLLKILWFTLRAFSWLTITAWRKRYDVVHVHNVPDFLVFAAVVPKLLGAKVILDIHDLLPEFYAGKFGAPPKSIRFRSLLVVEKLSCGFADHVIVANHLWHDKVTRRSAPPARCTPMLNYPEVEFFRSAVTKSRASHSFLMLYPGTLNHHQGVDCAVAAFAQACSDMPGARFLIYGEGPAREELRAQARALGIADRVGIHDPVPLEDVPALMASVDVGIVPKRADGFGNEAFSTKILEFMAAGVPVIVSRTRIDSYYFDDRTVRFFEPGNADDLAQQMRWAFQRPLERQQLAVAGNRHALECSWEKHSSEYIAIVDDLTCGVEKGLR